MLSSPIVFVGVAVGAFTAGVLVASPLPFPVDARQESGEVEVLLRERVEMVRTGLQATAAGDGLAVYRANAAHEPFVHVDTRGRRARW